MAVLNCTPYLRENWRLVGVEEDNCEEFMEKVEKESPEIVDYYKEDLFIESLEKRIECAKKRDWCGVNSPAHRLSGWHVVDNVDVFDVAPAEELTVNDTFFYSGLLSKEVSNVIGEDAYISTTPDGVSYDEKGRVREFVHKIYSSKEYKVLGEAIREVGNRTDLIINFNGKTRRLKLPKIIEKWRKEGKIDEDTYKRYNKLITGHYLPTKGKVAVIMKISTNPIDVAKKSTGQRWTSCERIGGEYDRGIFSDIKNWNAVLYAWVVKQDKWEKKKDISEFTKTKPHGRVMIRHCYDTDTNEPKILLDGGYGIFYGFEHDEKKAIEVVKKLIKDINPDLITYTGCETPYIYHGYSNVARGPNTSVRVGSGVAPLIDEDEWLRRLEDEWDEWFSEYDYEAYIWNPYAESVFDYMYYLESLANELREIVESYWDYYHDRNPWDYYPQDVLGEDRPLASEEDYIMWNKYIDNLRKTVNIIRSTKYAYGVVVDPDELNAVYRRGAVLYLRSPTYFPLNYWKDLDYDKLEEFNECVPSDYDDSDVAKCLEEVFGTKPLREWVKTREYEDEVMECIEDFKNREETSCTIDDDVITSPFSYFTLASRHPIEDELREAEEEMLGG
jgi:hypothetical protein